MISVSFEWLLLGYINTTALASRTICGGLQKLVSFSNKEIIRFYFFQCFQHFPSFFLFTFSLSLWMESQQWHVMVMIKPSFYQAICSQLLEMEYGMMEHPAEGNT